MNEKEAVAPVLSLCNSPFPLLQQLVQFIINRLDVRADNDLKGVFPRADDGNWSCRLYCFFIYPIVVLDLDAQTGSAVAGTYYVLFAAEGFQNILCPLCILACFSRVSLFLSRFVFPGAGIKHKNNGTHDHNGKISAGDTYLR